MHPAKRPLPTWIDVLLCCEALMFQIRRNATEFQLNKLLNDIQCDNNGGDLWCY